MKNTFKNFGPIYVINLKRREDRKKYMESEFKKYNIKNYHFFEAIDGTKDLVRDMVSSSDIPISDGELACTISHLSVIKHWLETSKSEYAIIMEDDLSFETVQYWDWTWEEFLNKIQDNYNMLQLSIINTRKINTSLHLREIHDTSANCYLITRKRAEEIVAKHFIDNKFVIPSLRLYAVADSLVYNSALCYSFPLFTYIIESSDLENDRGHPTKHIHEKSKKEVLDFWQTKPKHIYKKIKVMNNNG